VLRRRIQSVWETWAQPLGGCRTFPELAGVGDRTGEPYVVCFLGCATVDDDKDSVKDGPGNFKGEEVSTAGVRPLPQRWMAGRATDHVLVTRRKSTPRRCDCYLSLLPPYSLPSFPLSASFQKPHPAVTRRVHPSRSWPPGPCSSVLRKITRYPKAVASSSASSPTLSFIAAKSFPFTVMTEYDYSPAAYEKYINTQLRVSNWVSSQSDHTQSYGNPFVPSTYISTKPLPAEQSSRRMAKSPPRSRSSTTSAPSSSTTTPTKPTRQPHVRSSTTKDVRPEQRHTPTRSMTMPAYQQAMVHHAIPGQTLVLPTSSRDRHDRQDKHHSSSRRSSNKSPSKSSHHSSRHDRSHHHRSSSTSRAYTTDRDASGRRVIHLEPDSRNKVVHLPPPQLGEQYVIIPPPGGKVELVVCYPTHHFFVAYH